MSPRQQKVPYLKKFILVYCIVERWPTTGSTKKWANNTKHVLVRAGPILHFGKIRFARKVHRTNKDGTKQRATKTETYELRF